MTAAAFVGECFLVAISAILIPLATFAVIKLLRLVDDCRAERERRDGR